MTRSSLLLLLCFLALWSASCRRDGEREGVAGPMPPDSLITAEKMAVILCDMHIVQAKMTGDRNAGIPPENEQGYFNAVCRKHGISMARYEQNLAWYRRDPEELMKIYDRVIVLLEEGRQRLGRSR